MKYIFKIDEKLPSLNEYTKACRTNKFIGAKMKDETENLIWFYIKQQIKCGKITSPVKIHFTWNEKNKKRDLDNICFAKKFILDALVKANVLEDDKQNYVVGFTDTFRYGAENNVIVEIEEVN